MRAITAYSKSSSFLISFIFMTLLFGGVAFNTYVLTVTNDDLLIRETEAAILADIGGFKSLYSSAGFTAVIQAVNERSKNVNNDFYYYLRDKNSAYVAGSVYEWPGTDVNLIKNGLLDLTVELREGSPSTDNMSEQSAIAMIVEFDSKETLLVARSVQQYEFAVWLAQTSSWVMIIIVCIIAILSIAVAYYVVSRINLIAGTAEKIITEGNLSDRLYVESEWDDLSKLTLTLNQLLDKVEQSINGIRSVSDNIAHDLRTPLTRLKSRLEELPENDDKQRLTDECDNILAIFNSLLRITYIETNAKRAGFENNDVALVLEDAIELYMPMMEEKSIKLQQKTIREIYTYCDKSLMFQVFTNVIDNALKFTPAEGKIEIQLDKEEDEIIIRICDSGTGVNEESLENLTRRFYRTEKSRTTSGNGLGLSLVAAVVNLHRGKLEFKNQRSHSGLCCLIRLPIQDVPEPLSIEA
ncbi:MAG: HAMP domain-containing sensor histidine kinase [Pseudomonadota bacterium]